MNGSDIILLDISMWLANRWCTQAASMVYGACHSLRTKWTVHMYTYIYIHMSVISINIWGHTSIHSITANNSRSKRDQLRCVSLTNMYIYICWSSVSVSKDTPSSTVPLPPWKRPKEVTRAVHCRSFGYIYICIYIVCSQWHQTRNHREACQHLQNRYEYLFDCHCQWPT